jgi:hypothetical protein
MVHLKFRPFFHFFDGFQNMQSVASSCLTVQHLLLFAGFFPAMRCANCLSNVRTDHAIENLGKFPLYNTKELVCWKSGYSGAGHQVRFAIRAGDDAGPGQPCQPIAAVSLDMSLKESSTHLQPFR